MSYTSQVTLDLSNKASKDVADAIMRNVLLAEDGQMASTVAMGGVIEAIEMAAATLSASVDGKMSRMVAMRHVLEIVKQDIEAQVDEVPR